MKRRVLVCGANLTALALSLGLMGCGSAGIDEGMPKGDLTPTVKMDPKMTDMTGRSFNNTAAAQKKAGEAAQSDAGGATEKK